MFTRTRLACAAHSEEHVVQKHRVLRRGPAVPPGASNASLGFSLKDRHLFFLQSVETDVCPLCVLGDLKLCSRLRNKCACRFRGVDSGVALGSRARGPRPGPAGFPPAASPRASDSVHTRAAASRRGLFPGRPRFVLCSPDLVLPRDPGTGFQGPWKPLPLPFCSPSFWTCAPTWCRTSPVSPTPAQLPLGHREWGACLFIWII